MAGYDQIIKIKAGFKQSAKEFFSFLQAVGRKYQRPIKINYRYLKRGRFYVMVEGSPGGIDALFQELILNKGLYYYLCSIRSSKKQEIANFVVIPIFQDLLENRFQNPYSRFVRRHLTGKPLNEKYVPGDFKDQFSHEFEVLFRKWDIGSIDNWNFIKDLDSLLTRFMLTQLEHRPGSRSPQFHILIDQTYRKGVGMFSELKGLFNEIHRLRTDGLHRLTTTVSHSDISELAFRIYNYFQYFDEFKESQATKTEKLHGKRYKRIKYGDEYFLESNGDPFKDENGNVYDWSTIANSPCHDCGAIKGQFHCSGCDVEQCPRCKGQFLSCSCKLQKDYR